MERIRTKKDIKPAIIGYGMMGVEHVEMMEQVGIAPVAIADKSAACRNRAAQNHPHIPVYPSIDAVFKKTEANIVVMVTPHNTHRDLVIKCLDAGRHVICDKPMAITTQECDDMIAAARRNRRMLSVFHNRHWDAPVLEAAAQVRRGAVGDIVRVEARMGRWEKPRDWWRSSRKIGGGVLYDWGVHIVEYALQIIDADMVEVTGYSHHGYWAKQSRLKKDTIEDEATAIVRFTNGVMLTLRITQIDADPRPGILEITGTKGTYIAEMQTWKLIRPQKNGSLLVSSGRNRKSQWWKYYRNIADHFTKGAPLVITPQWARRPVHILDLAGRSAREGKTLRVKYR